MVNACQNRTDENLSCSHVCFGNFLSYPSDNGSVAWITEGKLWYMSVSEICNAILNHYPWGSLEFPFQHVFSDLSTKKHQCPGLKCVANAATSVALCKSTFIHCNVVEHRHEYDSFIKKFWSLPVPVFSEKCFSIALLKLPSLIFR